MEQLASKSISEVLSEPEGQRLAQVKTSHHELFLSIMFLADSAKIDGGKTLIPHFFFIWCRQGGRDSGGSLQRKNN